MQNPKLRLHADESQSRRNMLVIQTRHDTTASTVSDPRSQRAQRHKSEASADTDHDFCDVGLIKEKLCVRAGTTANVLPVM